MEDTFMTILDLCQDLDNKYLEQLIGFIEGIIEERGEEEND